MRTSTSRGHRCICQATIQLVETGLFREFQYLTVPLFATLDMMRAAISAATPAIDAPATDQLSEDKLQALYSLR